MSVSEKRSSGVVINMGGVVYGDARVIADYIARTCRDGLAAKVTFRRIFGFIAELARLQVAHDAASLSRPGLTRGDWLAMRGGK